MDSMYGSHAGISFVLSGSFTSYSEMVKAFQKGPTYKDVWYGQYAILDTPNKNDKTNGQIYRRGLDYSNKSGGAEYVGQIVGPSSGTPYFAIDSLKGAQAHGQKDLADNEYRKYPTGRDSDGNFITTSASGTPAVFDYDVDDDLRPGKYVDEEGVEKFNDTIQYTWVNIRKDNADADSWFYVGWSFPYTVIDYKIHQTSPYDPSTGNVLSDATEIARVDDGTHPYYEYWNLGLPKGIKGDTLRNLRVISAADEPTIYSVDNITVDAKSGETTFGDPGYDGQEDDVANGRKILVCDYYVYDKQMLPSKKVIFLGDYNVISGVRVDADGTVRVDYTHDDQFVDSRKVQWIDNVTLTSGNGKDGGTFTVHFNNGADDKVFKLTWVNNIKILEDGSVVYTYSGSANGDSGVVTDENLLKWIKDVSLSVGDGKDGGTFRVKYNNNSADSVYNLTWVKDIEVEDDGTIIYTYSGTNGGTIRDDGKVTIAQLIKWVKSVSLGETDGRFEVDFNDGSSYTNRLGWVKNIAFDESTGTITIYRTTDDTDDGTTSEAKLKLLTSMSTSDTGVVTLTFNTGETATMKKTGSDSTYQLKTIKNVTLAKDTTDDIAKDKRIVVNYNTGESDTIGSPINYVTDMRVRPDDFHLLVLFNDPTHRPSTDSTGAITYPQGTTAADWVSNSDVRNTFGTSSVPDYGASVYWRDYGTIKDQHGILIGMNVDHKTITDAGYTDVVKYLNATYPSGLTSGNTKQKVVTYSPGEDAKADKEFYAFDYNYSSELDEEGNYKYKGWYYVGTITDTGTRDVVLGNRGVPTLETTLNTEGLYFVTTTPATSTSAIPAYWDSTYVW